MIEPDRVVSARRGRLVGRLRRVVGPRGGGGEARPAPVVPLPRRRGPDPGRTPFDVPATPGFLGRLDELDRLVGAPDGLLRRHRVVVLAGDRGVGTSWLLCRAGHDSWEAGLLRDGRVHVDLRGGPGPLTPREALDRMAEQAGVGELPVTGSDAEAANHLRHLLAGRRILFLVDNADRPDQLGPLLAVQCHLLVAGGPGLRGLPGAAVLEVPRLGRRDAVGLCQQAHPRRHREPREDYERGVAAIGRLFASQPKVLHELGGWGDRRRPPAAELALGLQRVLDAPPYVAVDRPDAVDAACRHHAAYAALSEPARRVARLLAMVTDPLPPGALTALLAPPLPTTISLRPPARRSPEAAGQDADPDRNRRWRRRRQGDARPGSTGRPRPGRRRLWPRGTTNQDRDGTSLDPSGPGPEPGSNRRWQRRDRGATGEGGVGPGQRLGRQGPVSTEQDDPDPGPNRRGWLRRQGDAGPGQRRRRPSRGTAGQDSPDTGRQPGSSDREPTGQDSAGTGPQPSRGRRGWLRGPGATGQDSAGTRPQGRWGRGAAGPGGGVAARQESWGLGRGWVWGRGMVEEALAELDGAGFLERRGDDVRLAPGLARLCRLHLHRDEPVRRRARAYVRLVRHLAKEAARQAERLAPATATVADRAAARAADEWFTRHRRLLHHLVTAPVLRHAGDSGRWRRTARITGARWAAGGQVEVAFPKARPARRAWWEVARALQAWYERHGYDRRGRSLCRSVRTVAAATGLTPVEGWAAHRLGVVALRRDDWTGAVEELAGAGRRWGRAERAPALTNRGVAQLHLGRVDEALADLRTARRLRSRRDRVGTGLTDLALGEAWHRHGRPDLARTHLVAAANALDGTDDAGFAAALADLVLVEAALGRMTVAVRTAREAERIYRELGDDAGATEVRLNTAIALLTFDPPRPEQADALLTGLITELAGKPPTPLLARVLLHAGDAARLRQRPATARLLWARAADTARRVDDPATTVAATRRLTADP